MMKEYIPVKVNCPVVDRFETAYFNLAYDGTYVFGYCSQCNHSDACERCKVVEVEKLSAIRPDLPIR